VPAKVVAGFSGVGKSNLHAQLQNDSLIGLDPTPYRDLPKWPYEYVEAVLEATKQCVYVLISTHPEVIGTLLQLGYVVTMVYPDETQQAEYHRRYVARGNSPKGVKRLTDRFMVNVRNLQAIVHPRCAHIVLRPGQYLADVMSL